MGAQGMAAHGLVVGKDWAAEGVVRAAAEGSSTPWQCAAAAARCASGCGPASAPIPASASAAATSACPPSLPIGLDLGLPRASLAQRIPSRALQIRDVLAFDANSGDPDPVPGGKRKRVSWAMLSHDKWHWASTVCVQPAVGADCPESLPRLASAHSAAISAQLSGSGQLLEEVQRDSPRRASQPSATEKASSSTTDGCSRLGESRWMSLRLASSLGCATSATLQPRLPPRRQAGGHEVAGGGGLRRRAGDRLLSCRAPHGRPPSCAQH